MIGSLGKAALGPRITGGLLGNNSPVQQLAIGHSKIARDHIFDDKLDANEIKNIDLAVTKLVSVVMERSLPKSSPSHGNAQGLQGIGSQQMGGTI